jgi:hypothetical protein
MPVIEPIPREDLDAASRDRLAALAGPIAASRYPLVLARNPAVLRKFLDEPPFTDPGLLGTRLKESLRIRSAQLGGCSTCQVARYDGGPGEEFVACMSDASQLEPRDALALEFLERMHLDHLSIDAAFYQRLGTAFSVPEILELGTFCAELVGGHRWVHTLDMLGVAAPVFPYEAPAPAPNR